MSTAKSQFSIGARIKSLRDHLGLNQTEFGMSLGVGQGLISALECGTSKPTETIILLLGYKYLVNRKWLSDGEEPMFIEQPGQTVTQSTRPVSEEAVPAFKISDALAMAARVLESGTSYATALYLNIQHFDRAIQAESRIVHLERNMRTLEERFMAMEEELKKLRQTQKDRDEELLEKKAV